MSTLTRGRFWNIQSAMREKVWNEQVSRLSGCQGELLLDLSCLESSPLTRRWIFCSSLLASFSAHSFGDKETDPEDRVEDLLVSSESRAAEAGLATRLGAFPSRVPLGNVWRAVVSRLPLSGMGIEKEYGLYLSLGRTAFRKGCLWTAEEAAAAAAIYV